MGGKPAAEYKRGIRKHGEAERGRFWEKRRGAPTPATRYMRDHSFQFGDEVLLYHDERNPAPESGPRLLAASVVQSAIEDFRFYFMEPGAHAREIYWDAHDYLFSDDESWPFSFVSLASHLDLNVGEVRRCLMEWCDKKRLRLK